MSSDPESPKAGLRHLARFLSDATGARIGILVFALLCMLLIPGLTLLGRDHQSDSEIAATGLPVALQDLERALGYDGFIHHFKNAILRPDEGVYHDLAVEDYETALEILRDIQAMGLAIDERFDIAALEGTLAIYRENLDAAREAQLAGLSIAEVDALVRTPDAEAAADLDRLHRSVTAGLTDWLARDFTRSRIQLAALSGMLFMIAVVLLMFLVATHLARRERERQSMELHDRLASLGQLTSGIAHDVNNLLATIYYAVDLTLGETIPDTSRKFLTSAQRAVERGQNLTARLLAFSRPQPGNAQTVEVARLFETIKELAAPQLDEGIRLRLSEESAGLTLHCDPAQVENALLNLVLNSRDAIKMSGQGRLITLNARIHEGDQLPHHGRDGDKVIHPLPDEAGARPLRASEHGYLLISVRDDGPGMPADVRKRALEPFFTTKASQNGSGLGLSIVYGFAQSAGGDMQIRSAPKEGTEVQLMLPRGQSADQPFPSASAERTAGRGPVSAVMKAVEKRVPEGSAGPVAPAGGAARRTTVLLAEDEPGLRELLTVTLEQKGFEVISAEDGRQALQLATSGEHFDLLLTDIVMPGGIDGFELARSVRESFPDLPVLYLTGNAGPILSTQVAVKAPVLRKPCPPDRLFEAIAKALPSLSLAPMGQPET